MTRKFDLSLLPPAPNLQIEQGYWDEGLRLVGGVDEAGRGAWAGPVAAAAVVLPPDPEIAKKLHGVNDSKQMTPAKRNYWAEQIRIHAVAWAVGFSSVEEIDEVGILEATRLAVRRALEGLSTPPEMLLLDYLQIPDLTIPQLPLVKGDARSLSIAAASIMAKTSRDAVMIDLARQYPDYSFERHKGYGTTQHQQALSRSGACAIHRKSFKPIQILERG